MMGNGNGNGNGNGWATRFQPVFDAFDDDAKQEIFDKNPQYNNLWTNAEADFENMKLESQVEQTDQSKAMWDIRVGYNLTKAQMIALVNGLPWQ